MDGDSAVPGLTTVSLVVNGRAVSLALEPRTHLADALRERLNLTGTHLGCEQGVCGACTVLLDGKPQRSCIAYAVDCDGSDITTIEGFDDDPTMTALRQAFSEHHALQCGFCTPGILITARDIVLRLGEVPEQRIREELSGNLCRCTGYVGIVAAVSATAAGRTPQMAPILRPLSVRAREPPLAAAPVAPDTVLPHAVSAGGPVVEERLRLAGAPDAVWTALSDLRRVAACLPGAALETLQGDQITGRIRVALGPVKASFSGKVTLTDLDPPSGYTITGEGSGGVAGFAKGSAKVALDDAGAETVLRYGVQAQVGGKLAQIGSRLIDATSRKMADEFFSRFVGSMSPEATGPTAS